MLTTLCPVCHTGVHIDAEPFIGLEVTCASCKVPLEVVWLFPLSLGCLEEESFTPPALAQLDEEITSFGS